MLAILLWVVGGGESFCRSVPRLTKLSILTCFPFPALPGFQKAPGAAEALRFFEKHRPQFLVLKQFRIVKHNVWCTSVFCPNLFRTFKKRLGALFRSFGSRGPLLRPRRKTQPTVVIGVRSATLFGQNGPGTREGGTFSKSLFLVVFSKIHAIRRVLRSSGGFWPSPGTLWGSSGGPTDRPRSRPL